MSSFTNLSVYSRPHVNVNGVFTKIPTLDSVYENIRLHPVYVWMAALNGNKNIRLLM